jgi:hypothetical protein
LEPIQTLWGNVWPAEVDEPKGTCCRCGKPYYWWSTGNYVMQGDQRAFVCYPCLRPEED